jgi:protein-S-isoprenylcysteine O-methyltransferase Ste14
MQGLIDTIESVLRWLGAIAGLGTLAYAIYNMLRAQSRPTGQQTGAAQKVLRSRYLTIATLLFVLLAYILWKPLPFQLPWLVRLILSLLGEGIFFLSLGLYLWGLLTLGVNFNASSGFGVRLHQAHQLKTRGPYIYIRHPMYVGVILAFWGGLLLNRTWTMLVFAVIMLGLIYRAHKEEEALTQAFGEEWEAYKRRVPGWIPRLDRMSRKNNR